LFAGLTALPKTTALTSYSYRLDHTRQAGLLTACGPSLTVRILASLMVRIPGMWNGPTGGAGGAVWSAG
jgi:hypothetical protein